MRIDEFRQILREFVREARGGQVKGISSLLITAAEQLEQGLGKGIRESVIKSDTISFSPSKCPCCGK